MVLETLKTILTVAVTAVATPLLALAVAVLAHFLVGL